MRFYTAFLLCIFLCLGAGDSHARVFRLFLLSGQSNATGCGNGEQLSDDLKTTDPRVLQYIVSLPPTSGGRKESVPVAMDQWQTMAPYPCVNPKVGIDKCAFGPELLFSKTVAEAYPEDFVGVVKETRGGQSIVLWDRDWRRPEWQQLRRIVGAGREVEYKDGLYDGLIAGVRRAAEQAGQMSGVDRVVISGMLWVQVERDCQREEGIAQRYQGELTSLIHNVREDLGVPNLPFLYIDTHSGPEDIQALIKTGLREIEKTIPQTRLIRVDDIPIQGVHFRTEGQIQLGRRMAETYLDMTRAK
ncbi:MAG: hypothetical protein NTW86_07185 [Candidatus Sumerlaeota bacterium]|nr:hypothetical protein [Candidatus Sumerlaeota bacterium]